MRLHRLNLIAYGPFQNVVLDFPTTDDGRPGLHIVFGQNEAGKSSALRALHAALYGISTKTADAFLHDYAKLRLGFTLQMADGPSVEFIRRKGNKHTLLQADGKTPLPDDALRSYLSHVGPEDFSGMFGLGAAELRVGGDALAEAKGLLSETLFAGVSGLPRLRQVETELANEVDSLFLRTGKLPPINAALGRLTELQNLQKQHSQSADEYLTHTHGVAAARRSRAEVDAQRDVRRLDVARLTRIQTALPTAARLRQYSAALRAVATAPRLAADFSARRQSVESAYRQTSGVIEQLQRDLALVNDERQQSSLPEALLAAGAEIERLYKRLGSHEKAAADARNLRPQLTFLKAEAAVALRALPAKFAQQADGGLASRELRLTVLELAEVRRLATRLQSLQVETRSTHASALTLRQRIQQCDAQAASYGPDVPATRLREALRRAVRDGDLDGSLASARSEATALDGEVAAALAALPLWDGDAAQVVTLKIPAPATLEAAEALFKTLDLAEARLTDREAEAAAALNAAHARLRQAVAGDVPSEETLRASRAARDLGWHEVRRDLAGRAPGPERSAFLELHPQTPLPEAYEAAVATADDIADRLRREADRVQQVSLCAAERDQRQAELAQLAEDRQTLACQRAVVQSNWAGHWTFLPTAPLSPREMTQWVARHTALLRLIATRTSGQTRASDAAKKIDAHRATLLAGLSDAGFDATPPEATAALHSLLATAQQHLDAIDAAGEDRRTLAAARQQASRDLQICDEAASEQAASLTGVQAAWTQWVQRLGLPDAAGPEAVVTLLDALTHYFGTIDQTEALQQRLSDISADADGFAEAVNACLQQAAPDLTMQPVETATAMLYERLQTAQRLRERYDALTERHADLVRQLSDVTARSADLAAQLQTLCQQAGCQHPTELPAAEAAALDRSRLEAETVAAEDELRQLSGGRSIDEFLEELDSADTDRLAFILDGLDEQIQALEQQRDALLESQKEHEAALRQMTGGAAAARAAEDAQAEIDALVGDVEQYVRLRLAGRLLRNGRDHFRQNAGDAVLNHAADIFAGLTGGAFAGLKVDYNEKDELVLFGIRPDAAQLRPDVMSTGTRDQLYLALRLAGLHAWTAAHEPLPLIVDDVLIQFDDSRAAAALSEMAELAAVTQVIFFTHHRHLLDVARAAVPAHRLRTQALGDATGALESGRLPAESAAKPKRKAIRPTQKSSLFEGR